MAQSSFYWTGKTSGGAAGDAGPYGVGTFRELMLAMLQDLSGVYNGLRVQASSPAAKTVDVTAGRGMARGIMYDNDAAVTLDIDDNSSGNPRIDRIVLRADWTAQTIRLAVLKGTPAGSPTAPALTQTDGTTWEVALAQVAVANGFSTIVDGNITREREFIGVNLPGEIKIWTSDAVPDGWQLCDGTAISRADNEELFDVIGTAYGVGDGSTTFNVPDLRGRVPLGQDDMGGSSADRVTNTQADTLGGSEGAEDHTLTESEMPSHTHSYQTPVWTASGASGGSTFTKTTTATVTGSTGGDGAHNNMQPYLTVNYIIKT